MGGRFVKTFDLRELFYEAYQNFTRTKSGSLAAYKKISPRQWGFIVGTHLLAHAASSEAVLGRVQALAPGQNISACSAGLYGGDPAYAARIALVEPGDWLAATNCLVELTDEEFQEIWIFVLNDAREVKEDWVSWKHACLEDGRIVLVHTVTGQRIEISLLTNTPLPNQSPLLLP